VTLEPYSGDDKMMKKDTQKPRSVCDTERDRRQNKDPLDEENIG
jgi:hypothetical protein